MARWARKPEECEGDYFFSGKGYVTQGVASSLSPLEIGLIIADLQLFVAAKNGVDYLQVYVSDDGRKVYCIDQLSKSMKESGDYSKEQLQEYDYWTLLLPQEY